MRTELAVLSIATTLLITPAAQAVSHGVDPAGQAPWAARIIASSSSGRALCSGSLVTNRHVLTAAHCARGRSSWEVKLAGKTLTTRKAAIAPESIGDLAILTLSRTVSVAPVPLAPSQAFMDGFTGRGVTYFGWGNTKVKYDRNHEAVESDPARSLQKTPDGAYTKTRFCQFGPRTVCFGKTRTFGRDGVAVLHGDSGGPWVAWNNGWVEIAVEHGGISEIAPSSRGPEGGPSVGDATVKAWIVRATAGSALAPLPSNPGPPPAVDVPQTPASDSGGVAPSVPVPSAPSSGIAETVGGPTHTWTNYANAGGTEGPTIQTGQTVGIACKLQGFKVADGNTWWYKIASSPWDGNYYASADAFYNNGQTSGSLLGTPWVDPSVPDCAGATPPPPPPPPPAPQTWSETVGGDAHTWTNYMNAGGTAGPIIPRYTTVQIACKLQGFRVADGNTWWYRIASSPWNGQFYVSADAFYNNGVTSGSLIGTPFVDPAVRDC